MRMYSVRCYFGVNMGTILTVTNPSTANTGSYTVPCSFSDNAGNNGTATGIYYVQLGEASSGGGGGSGTGAAIAPVTETTSNQWTQITPSAPVIMTNFAADSGVSQIQISVNSPANNVNVQVQNYNSLPLNVSTTKSGTYKYLHITIQNLSEVVSNAIVTTKVDKSWLSQNSLSQNDVALFEYNASSNQWNQLETTFQKEDANYDYYSTNLTHFSYFAIASTLTPVENTTTVPPAETQQTVTEGFLGLSYLDWIIIAAVVLIILIPSCISLAKKRASIKKIGYKKKIIHHKLKKKNYSKKK